MTVSAKGVMLAAAVILGGTLSWATGGRAEGLALPIDCDMRADCRIAKYVDLAPGGAARDFHCGPMTNHQHKGTDIRLRDYRQMEDGVAVLAAAAGQVTEIRDGMADVSVRLVGEKVVGATDVGASEAVGAGVVGARVVGVWVGTVVGVSDGEMVG